MRPHLRLLSALSLIGSALGQGDRPMTSASTVSTFLTQHGRTVRAGAICDGQNATGQVAVVVIGRPDARGRTQLSVYNKAQPGSYSHQNVKVGEGDAGASNIHYALSRAGRPVGKLHYVSSGVLDDPGQVLTPIFASLDLGNTALSCRWEPGTRLLGFDGRRSLLITEAAGGALTYQSFDFKDRAASDGQAPRGVTDRSRPSSKIVGGARRKLRGGELFIFQRGGYTIAVQASTAGRATLTVSRGGQVLQSNPLTGFTYAVRK